VLAVLVGVVGALNFDNNRVTVEALNRTRWYPAAVAAGALSAGIMDGVPQGAWVVSNVDTAWQVNAFYQLHAGKSVAGVVPLGQSAALQALPLRAVPGSSAEATAYSVAAGGAPVYYLHIENAGRDAGYALLSRVETVTIAPGRVSVGATPLLVYRAWPRPAAYDWQEISGWPARPVSYEPTATAGPAAATGSVVASGGDWVMVKVPPGWTVTQAAFDAGAGRSWLDFAPPEWSRSR
jgi:hypothetical protein